MNNNQSLHSRRQKAVAQGVGQAHPRYTASALNSHMTDVDGRDYIDFAGGIAVLNTGHRHPRVVEAVKDQLDHVSHTCFQVFGYENYITLAERLNALAPGDFEKKTVLLTSGAEAVENAVKIARASTGRRGVIAFQGGYHGRTLLTMGLTGKMKPYKAGFGPFPAEIFHARFPSELEGVSIEDALESIDALFHCDISPEDVAAIIIEPVQGEGGFRPAPKAFMQALRTLCDEHGILLICDEVQTGAGRTGTFFAVEQSGIAPDLITTAKSLAGGFPLSAVVGRAEVMDAIGPGGLGGTYAGNPLACAAALAVLDVFEEEQLLERGKKVGEHLRKGLNKIAEEFDCIAEVRGMGPMLAMELCEGRDPKRPAAELTRNLLSTALDMGLVLLSCGPRGNVVRILVPLTVDFEDLDKGLDIIAESLRKLR